MALTVTIINFKGGVGKTTCSVEIACSLAKHYGQRTLLVDLDPQASATFYVMKQERWLDWKKTNGTTYDLFKHRDRSFPLRQAILKDVISEKVFVPGFDLLPSTPDLIGVDLGLSDFVGHNILQRYLDLIGGDYDFIICDCPPNFNPVTKNSLQASDAYVIPTVPDFLSTYGIGLLQRCVNKFFNYTAPNPDLGGIILTRVRDVNMHKFFCEQVCTDYPNNVFHYTISDSIQVATAADNHLPISAILAPKGLDAKLQTQFQALAGEFMNRITKIDFYRKRQNGK